MKKKMRNKENHRKISREKEDRGKNKDNATMTKQTKKKCERDKLEKQKNIGKE